MHALLFDLFGLFISEQSRTSFETLARTVGVEPDALLPADLAALGAKDEAMVSFARSLNRSGFTMGMLSNIPCDFVGWTRWHNPWIDELFDPVLFSCRLRLAKPDEEIFAVALARLSQSAGRKLAPEDVLFVDDSPKNVEAATKLGFLGHCFENLEALSAKIEAV